MIFRLLKLSLTKQYFFFLFLVVAVPFWLCEYLATHVFEDPSAEAMLLPFSALPALLFIFQVRQRATLFELALPVPTRTLFEVRALKVFLSIWVPVCSVLLLGAISDVNISIKPVLCIGSALTLTAAAIQSVRINEIVLPWRFVLSIGTAIMAGIFIVSHSSAAIVFSSCVLAAGLLLGVTWIRMPVVFEIAPRREASKPQSPSGERMLPWAPWLPAARAFVPWNAGLMLLAAAPYGLSGNWVTSILWSCIACSQFRPRSSFLACLPISRSKLLAFQVLPILALMLAGYQIGIRTLPLKQRISYTDGHVEVPFALWKHVSGGQIPVVVSPWGETSKPPIETVLKVPFYSPYFTSSANTMRFIQWQTDRAAKAMNATNGLRSALGSLNFKISGGFLIAAGTICGMFLLQQGLRQRGRVQLPRQTAVVAGEVLFAFGLCLSVMFENVKLALPGAIHDALLIWLLQFLPPNPWFLALLCSGILVVLYTLLDAQTRGIEISSDGGQRPGEKFELSGA